MKRALVFGFVGIILVSATGCGGEAENVVKQSVADMNALAEALEKKESPDNIKAAAERVKGTLEKAKGMKVSKREDERLKKKYEQPLQDAMKRYQEAAEKNPEGARVARGAMAGITP